MTEAKLTRTAASRAVESIGWRYLLGTLCASVATESLTQSAELAGAVVHAAADDADHLRIDLRTDRIELSVQSRDSGILTERDVAVARRITAALAERGFATGGATTAELSRPVQMLEIAIDATDIPAVRPFWKAVFAYTDEPMNDAPDAALIDPTGQLATVWFQQMDEPRTDRNRVHFDITVAHDEAEARVRAALDAGGVLVSDAHAKSFWVLADVEGNEVCVCTWLDRDERGYQD